MTRRPASEAINGFLNIDKAPGETSTGAVRAVKRITGCRKVGHGGTLDPLAAGVLPICIGQATRFADVTLLGSKVYALSVRLGVATDTYDADGTATLRSDPSSITQDQVAEVLGRFRGRIRQVPPMYSAMKRDGKRLYRLAREGIEVERQPREVVVHSLRLTGWSPPDFALDVECGHGFYARSLAHDIGVALSSAAHLASLVRRRSGPFVLDEAVTLESLEEAAARGDWRSLLFPVDTALRELPAIVLDPLQAEQVRHGRPIDAGALGRPAGDLPFARPDGERVRAYDREGELVAAMVYSLAGFVWRPEKVIAAY